jgi:hypothetical protein
MISNCDFAPISVTLRFCPYFSEMKPPLTPVSHSVNLTAYIKQKINLK